MVTIVELRRRPKRAVAIGCSPGPDVSAAAPAEGFRSSRSESNVSHRGPSPDLAAAARRVRSTTSRCAWLPPTLCAFEAALEQPPHCAGRIALRKGVEALEEPQSGIVDGAAIGSGRLEPVRQNDLLTLLPTSREPGDHEAVPVVEDVDGLSEEGQDVVGQILGAALDVHAEEVQPPEERRCVDDIEPFVRSRGRMGPS